ncbi:uncharacterized protein J3R85_008430 [Psidium guajava]|nr:uncharacterized protein J3R85_008430 [Psidium guajava]
MATGTTTAAATARQLSQKEADIQMMLAVEVHLGTKNCDFQMERYVFKRRNDGPFLVIRCLLKSAFFSFERFASRVYVKLVKC